MDQVEMFLLGLSILLNIIVLVGVMPAAKKLLKDLLDALEDNQISRDEFNLIIQDGLSIIKIIKNLLGR
jgi:hypothetical protein